MGRSHGSPTPMSVYTVEFSRNRAAFNIVPGGNNVNLKSGLRGLRNLCLGSFGKTAGQRCRVKRPTGGESLQWARFREKYGVLIQ